jgi:hypothetical protein
LKPAGQKERAGGYHPYVLFEPTAALHKLMDLPISQMRRSTEAHPDGQISQNHQGNKLQMLRPLSRQTLEDLKQGERGRQHHRDCHQRPTCDV